MALIRLPPIIREECINKERVTAFVINLYKGNGDALQSGNYRGLKQFDQVMKVMERIIEKCIRSMVNIDEMQFKRGIIDTIFILRPWQEKFLRTGNYILPS